MVLYEGGEYPNPKKPLLIAEALIDTYELVNKLLFENNPRQHTNNDKVVNILSSQKSVWITKIEHILEFSLANISYKLTCNFYLLIIKIFKLDTSLLSNYSQCLRQM